jgi:hypothetical protein
VKRTLTQNRAIHLYFKWLADTLNDAGLDIAATLQQDFQIPWNEHTVKELIWRRVQNTITDKESTSKLDTKEVGEIFEIINRHLSTSKGVTVPFPHYDGIEAK